MINFDVFDLPSSSAALRNKVRTFLGEHRDYLKRPNSDFASGHVPEFSRLLGQQGWIGMTWPSEYGGQNASAFDRYVVTEELLAAGAPVGAHWIADRQSGPLLLKFGTDEQKARYLPRIVKGDAFFSIGISEPDSGSDLASIQTKAELEGDEYRINGTKVWTTHAHRNHFMICLVRTDRSSDNRHAGLSQIIIDLQHDPVQIRPIKNIGGDLDFNEVVFEDVMVPKERIVGSTGQGWEQVTSELALERSGPERFLSSFQVFIELVRTCGTNPSAGQAVVMGKIASHLMALRRMSLSVAGMLGEGQDVAIEAALIKELGNNFEKNLLELARLSAPPPWDGRLPSFNSALCESTLLSPSFTLRGGTREVLRGVIARELGLR